MNSKLKLSNGITVEISNTAFASGGEADVYQILSPGGYSEQVLKIYKADKISKEKEEKLKHLIANRPNLVPINDHHSVIWPIHLAFESNRFVGYTMPKATGVKLELLCHPKLPKNLPKEFEKYSFQTPGAIEARLKLCYNISAALSQIHSFGSYVLVDMKPDNVMVKPDGFISIIDIDSTEIISAGKMLFPAQVVTPEYTPPEYYSKIKSIENTVIEETWDRFSLSVIFYRLLLGIHPFTASLKPPFDTLTNVSDIIQKGFLPVGKAKDKFKVVPPPHNKFSNLDGQVRQLFIAALEDGNHNPIIRPSADDWCRVLSPDPGIQLNRKLPTRLFSGFVPNYSKQFILKQVPEVRIIRPHYIIKGKENILRSLLRLFYKTAKDKKWITVISSQKNVDKQLLAIESLKSSLENSFALFDRQQISILDTEKKAIDRLLNKFNSIALTVDKKAQDLFIKETARYIEYQKTFIKEYNFLEYKIKEQFDLTVKKFETDSYKQKAQLNAELTNLNSRENEQIRALDIELKNKLEEVKKRIQVLERSLSDKVDIEYRLKLEAVETKRNALKTKEKKLLTEALEKYQTNYGNNSLSQYKIYDDRYSIFTDQYADPDRIVSNLSAYGINSAADIKGVDESGRILRSNGSWVKVSEVAASRARKLDDWRQRKQRQNPTPPPQTLPYSEEMKVKQITGIEYQKIDEEEKLITQEINRQKNKIPLQLTQHLEEAKKTEQSFTSDIQDNKARIAHALKIERDKIQRQINEANASYIRSKAIEQERFDDTTKIYKANLDRIKIEKERYWDAIKKEFDSAHMLLIKELAELELQFKSEQNVVIDNSLIKLQVNSKNYEGVYTDVTAALKTEVDNFNTLVNELIFHQSEYNSTK